MLIEDSWFAANFFSMFAASKMGMWCLKMGAPLFFAVSLCFIIGPIGSMYARYGQHLPKKYPYMLAYLPICSILWGYSTPPKKVSKKVRWSLQELKKLDAWEDWARPVTSEDSHSGSALVSLKFGAPLKRTTLWLWPWLSVITGYFYGMRHILTDGVTC